MVRYLTLISCVVVVVSLCCSCEPYRYEKNHLLIWQNSQRESAELIFDAIALHDSKRWSEVESLLPARTLVKKGVCALASGDEKFIPALIDVDEAEVYWSKAGIICGRMLKANARNKSPISYKAFVIVREKLFFLDNIVAIALDDWVSFSSQALSYASVHQWWRLYVWEQRGNSIYKMRTEFGIY